MTQIRQLQHGDVLLLRAAVLPLTAQHTQWPDPDDPADCRRWLVDVAACSFFTSLQRSRRRAGR